MVFGRKDKPTKAYDGPPLDPQWVRNARGKFSRLLHLDTENESIKGVGGVYVIWHSGVKPGWVYVDKTTDFASAFDAALDNEDIMEYEKNGGLYVTWSPILEKRQNGVLRFLNETMQPKVENRQAASIADGPINVVLPSRRNKLGLSL